jgi:hypothetical protein
MGAAGSLASKPLKTERGFFGALLKGKELHVLKPLNLSGFGFLPLKHPLFDFIVAHEGIETSCGFGVWRGS